MTQSSLTLQLKAILFWYSQLAVDQTSQEKLPGQTQQEQEWRILL